MRLIEIKKIIEDNIDKISFENISREEDGTTINGNTNYKITGHCEVINSLEKLYETGLVDDYIIKLRKFSYLYNTSSKVVYCDNSQINQFKGLLNSLISQLGSIQNIISKLVEKQNINSISVKFPETNDLNKFADNIKKINKVFSQIVCNDIINGKVEMDKVDSGSIWIDVCLGSSSAVMIVGSAIWSAAVIKKKFLEAELLKKKVEAFGIKNNSLDLICKAMDKELENIYEGETSNILSSNNIDNDNPEYKSRILYGVKELHKLLEEGFEIYNNIDAPEEVRNLFPNFKDLNLLESKIPKLKQEEKGNKESKE